MDCIVWACGLARAQDDELPPPIPRTSLQPKDIDEEEKERRRDLRPFNWTKAKASKMGAMKRR